MRFSLNQLAAALYFAAVFLFPVLVEAIPKSLASDSQRTGITPDMIEADWLRQAASWRANPTGTPPPNQVIVSTSDDAVGAVDGVKNGKYSFHTIEEPNPWWSVDLQQSISIARIVIYNRLDYEPGLHNADNLVVLVSENKVDWKRVYAHPNRFFGGVAREKPLGILFQPAIQAQYVRLTIPSEKPIYLHLDEVEVFASDDPAKNIAIHCPADQSSVSQWSTKKSASRVRDAEEFPTGEFISKGKILAHFLNHPVAHEILKKLEGLEQREVAGEKGKAIYLETRWAIRELAFSNPLLEFDELLFVKRFTQQTYPDICLNNMPWVSRPGGDICILEHPFAVGRQETNHPVQTVREIIGSQLGPGHVHGVDLHWDGKKIVFAFAKQESFPFTVPVDENVSNTDNDLARDLSNPAKQPLAAAGLKTPLLSWPPPFCAERHISHELRSSQEPIHIFTIDIDGQNLRQLTDDPYWSDLDPTWLPSDEIAFASERCGYALQCNHDSSLHETACNIYAMKNDGSGIRRLNVNKDGDYLPHALDDGTIGYTRWEYQERNLYQIQSLWSVRPDGTGADVLFKQHLNDPWALEDVRSVPHEGSMGKQFVATATGHHTIACGPIVVLSPTLGLSAPEAIRIVTPGSYPPEGGMSGTAVEEGGVHDDGGYYMNPWALSDRLFLASYSYGKESLNGLPEYHRGMDERGYAIYLIDVFGTKELVYRDPNISSSVPMPLVARKRPLQIASNLESSEDYAICTLSEASFGVTGLQPGEAKYLRISQGLPWIYTKETGGQRYEWLALDTGLNWTPKKVLGTVPIRDDGNVSFRVPADESVYFQLLDADFQEIRRMRSFVSFQPGEIRGCVGCHETMPSALLQNTSTFSSGFTEVLDPVPPSWGDQRAINFLTDVQPVLDRNCVRCHHTVPSLKNSGEQQLSKVPFDFSGGLVGWTTIPSYAVPAGVFRLDGHNRAYRTILENHLISVSDRTDEADVISSPRMFGSSQSRLIRAITSGPCPFSVKEMPHDDYLSLVTWIDANAPYHDRFINVKAEKKPYDLAADKELFAKILSIHERRCNACHIPDEVSRLEWIDLRNPEQSRLLTAPATKCTPQVYKNQNDPDYKVVREMLEHAVKRVREFPRRDLETFFTPSAE